MVGICSRNDKTTAYKTLVEKPEEKRKLVMKSSWTEGILHDRL